MVFIWSTAPFEFFKFYHTKPHHTARYETIFCDLVRIFTGHKSRTTAASILGKLEKMMSIITFAQSKGGAGKTTSAIILATTLARNHKVAVIDADPAGRLMSWASKAPLKLHIQVGATRGEKFIQDEIAEAASLADIVIVDLEGAATRLNAYAMAESDLVIIPMGNEQSDAEGAIDTLAALSRESRTMRREIPARVLFARTKAVGTSRLARSLNAQVRNKVGSFQTELRDRGPFSALHNYGGSLYDLKKEEVSGIPQAIANAELFAEELLKTLGWVSGARGWTIKAKNDLEKRNGS